MLRNSNRGGEIEKTLVKKYATPFTQRIFRHD